MRISNNRIAIDHQLLVEIGLGHLNEDQQRLIKSRIYEITEMRVGLAITGSLTNAQKEIFESLIDKDAEAAEAYLERVIPNYAVVVRNELEFVAHSVMQSLRQGRVVVGQDVYQEQGGEEH